MKQRLRVTAYKTGLLGHAHKSSAFFLTVTHYHILLCSIRHFSMENLTTSFSCVNMKIQQVTNIVSHVICLVLLYTQEKDVDLSFLLYMQTLFKKYDQGYYRTLQVLTNNDSSILVKFRSGSEHHHILDYSSSFHCYKSASFQLQNNRTYTSISKFDKLTS